MWVTLLMAGLASPVRAQGGTLISVQPPASQVPVGSDLLIELYVTNGVDVNAFDVTITYDPGLLTLNSWAHGGYLKNLAVVSEVNQPGSLRLAATQLASPPVSGDGVLLKLNFRAAAAGTSAVTITRAEFASSTGVKTEPERVNGTVTAVSAPTFTPTATVTATRTPTATATRTPTMMAMATLTSTWTLVPTLTATAWVLPTASPLPGATATSPAGAAATVIAAEGRATPGAPTPTVWDAQGSTLAPGTGEPAEAPMGEPTIAAVETPGSAGWLGGLLWGGLIAGGAAVLVMILIIIRRRTRREGKEKDLLI